MKKIILIVIILLVLSCIGVRVLVNKSQLPHGRYEVVESYYRVFDGKYTLKIKNGVETYTVETSNIDVAKAKYVNVRSEITPCP